MRAKTFLLKAWSLGFALRHFDLRNVGEALWVGIANDINSRCQPLLEGFRDKVAVCGEPLHEGSINGHVAVSRFDGQVVSRVVLGGLGFDSQLV